MLWRETTRERKMNLKLKWMISWKILSVKKKSWSKRSAHLIQPMRTKGSFKRRLMNLSPISREKKTLYSKASLRLRRRKRLRKRNWKNKSLNLKQTLRPRRIKWKKLSLTCRTSKKTKGVSMNRKLKNCLRAWKKRRKIIREPPNHSPRKIKKRWRNSLPSMIKWKRSLRTK